jgi:hypothetical protein
MEFTDMSKNNELAKPIAENNDNIYAANPYSQVAASPH